MFALEYLFKNTNHQFVSGLSLVSGPYSKIRTAEGTNQNASFRHGPVQLCNKQ